jgi:hypothetical protein
MDQVSWKMLLWIIFLRLTVDRYGGRSQVTDNTGDKSVIFSLDIQLGYGNVDK